ncbi:MAG: DUF92 domain-containing protein [Thermoplasmata archaeon]|nr:DUF92 domain-containing protein [Thermoplasmata archaeon]
MNFWESSILIAIICLTLSLLAYWKSVLTKGGSIAAFFVGIVIGIMGHISWIFLLLVFFLTSFIATKYKFDYKKSKGLQEGKRGERKMKNVLANGAVPIAVAVLSWQNDFYPYLDKELGSILFITAIAVAASDTMASELGILSKRVYLITNRRRVKAGVDGGVSALGQFAAFIAAAYTALLGFFTFSYFDMMGHGWWVILLVTFLGFLGCQVDSVFGATLERRGILTKLSNNLSSIAIGTILAWVVMTWLV